ncbi:MAG: pyruvate kinase [Clostridiaceae bacterium]|nr:pyruvate kinase [Clostridiaceae bacterium]
MRRTKIVCTVGPAVDTEEKIEKLMLAGMDAARFNFSHGTHESHLATLEKVKRVRDRLGLPIAAILDTKGPEIRIKTFKDGKITLNQGDTFTLTTASIDGDNTRVSVTYDNLHKELTVGSPVLIDDGLVGLEVEKIEGADIVCRVISGGDLSNNKSINLPASNIRLPSMTEKDKADIVFGIENGFDFIAASFVRKASDIEDIRALLKANGGGNIAIIAKIENREGVDNMEEILTAADGVMVARGDLGVEIPAYEVPPIQKKMIEMSIRMGKTVITATQMLDSMIRNPRPTRAEVSDVANAVFDGSSAVMLSGETASGKYPIESVDTMAKIVEAAEQSINYWKRFASRDSFSADIPTAISHTACMTARDLGARAILAATTSGYTARSIARFMPGCPIAAMTTTEVVRRSLALTWGVRAYLAGSADSTDRMFSLCSDTAKKEGIADIGDRVVITAGVPLGCSGTTNLIKADVIK